MKRLLDEGRVFIATDIGPASRRDPWGSPATGRRGLRRLDPVWHRSTRPFGEGRLTTPGDLEELGRRIRKLRIERRLTLKQVESASGLSATHLSEIERGRTSPTIGALIRIARSLGKRPSYFIEPEELEDVAYVPAEGGRSLALASGVTAESLSPGIPGSELFAYRLTFRGEPAAEWTLSAHTSPGDAMYFVVAGTIEATLGDRMATLGSGDAIQGPTHVAHRLVTTGGEPAEVVAVLTRPLEPS